MKKQPNPNLFISLSGHKGMWQVIKGRYNPLFGWIMDSPVLFSTKKSALDFMRRARA